MFLPLEIEVSLGMRKYIVIITSDRGLFPVFRRELGHYALPVMETELEEGRRRAVVAHMFVRGKRRGRVLWVMLVRVSRVPFSLSRKRR